MFREIDPNMTSTAYNFAPPYQTPRGSAIRELAKLAADPSVISFAGGYPAAESFDLPGLRQAADAAWEANPQQCMQYGATEGLHELRDVLLDLSERRGIGANPDELLVTTGSQQAFDFLLRSNVVHGDTVLVENPTYPGALAALRLAGANVIGIDGDTNGIDTDAVERVLSTLPDKPKMLYVVANFANPTGATLTRERRIKLLELAAQHQFLLVEDDPYGALRFAGETVPPMRALASEVPSSEHWSVYLSTLSKVVTPGIRIGWLVAPAAVTRRCVMAKQVSDMCSSPWNQAIAYEYLSSSRFASTLPGSIEIYRLRANALSDSLHQTFGDKLSFAKPEGGMFLWANFVGKLDMQKLFDNAVTEQVLFIPGSQCYFDTRASNSLRLSYATSSPEAIQEGVARLHRAYIKTV